MKVCLIGSSRFLDEYHRANKLLTLAGHIVYSIAMVSSSERGTDGPNISEDEKETLDLVHLRKIQESDIVALITDKSRYVGASTKREIKWAYMLGKPIYDPDWILKQRSSLFSEGFYYDVGKVTEK